VRKTVGGSNAEHVAGCFPVHAVIACLSKVQCPGGSPDQAGRRGWSECPRSVTPKAFHFGHKRSKILQYGKDQSLRRGEYLRITDIHEVENLSDASDSRPQSQRKPLGSLS
jgi:hypothetical protein